MPQITAYDININHNVYDKLHDIDAYDINQTEG